MGSPPTVNCPRCGAPVVWGPASRFRPFCSERCKLLDLGAWATEQYRVATDDPQKSEPTPDQPQTKSRSG